jgi:hypothetical protein
VTRATSLRLLLALLALVLITAGGGFLRGALVEGGAGARDAAQDEAAAPAPHARPVAPALQALDANGHWGRYTAASPGPQPADSDATQRPSVALDDVARGWRLVGIEQRGAQPVALLLPAGAQDGSTDVLRLKSGEELVEGIRVSAIGRDSVRFLTPGGSSTLYLYENGP